MRAVAVLTLALTACGRLGFVEQDDAGTLAPSDGEILANADAQPALDAAPFPAGLVAHYPMDSITGGVLDDALGLDGTCTQCPTVDTGHIGMALVFDGVNDCIMVP